MAPKICSIAPSSNTDTVLSCRSLIKISNSQTKKKKNAKLSSNCSYRKKFISKDMKAINYKMKKLNRFVYSSEGSPRDLQLIRTCLTPTKRTSNMTKIKNCFTFFVSKTGVEGSKFITNSLKTLDFVTPIPLDTIPWQKMSS